MSHAKNLLPHQLMIFVEVVEIKKKKVLFLHCSVELVSPIKGTMHEADHTYFVILFCLAYILGQEGQINGLVCFTSNVTGNKAFYVW